tara:strand:+ start:920 stop:2236 length:1317 start_codon:yes stop_codon:yes gene_type:complete
MKPIVLVTAPVATRSGYGAHARDIVRSLIAMERFDVRIYPVRWGSTPWNALNGNDENDKPILERLLKTPDLERQPDVHIHIVVPNEFAAMGKYNIGITAGIETSACPHSWIEGLNRMDLNIVPSTFSKEVLEEVVYDQIDDRTKKRVGEVRSTKPIEVLFEGADTNIFKKVKTSDINIKEEFKKIKEDFCFLFVGHWLQGNIGEDRKDCYMLVKTFFETFKNQKNKPALIMKTSSATPCILDREELFNKINHMKSTVKGDLPNVYLLHGDLTDNQMNELYNHGKVKAHVSFTHGEGFGRPLLEASISQKPVITTSWSGPLDFLSDKLSVLLPADLTDVKSAAFPEEIYVEGSQWSTVNYQYSSKILKDVRNNYKNYRFNARKQAMVNRGKFSLEAMTKKFENILDKYLPEFSEEVKLNLPGLNKTQEGGIKLPKLTKD